MAQDGLQLQQLFTALALSEEERAALLRAVVKAEPAFSPPPQTPPQVNTSTLLREIYAQVSPDLKLQHVAGSPCKVSCVLW
jgi:DNA-directed RNA polymerase